MRGDSVPDTDHILRYIGGRHIDATDNGSFIFTGGGFIAKPMENNQPSCNWIECLEGSLEDQVQQIRDRARLKYGAIAKLVRLNVGKIRQHIQLNTVDNRAVTVIHDPLAPEGDKLADPSHALMTNVPDENSPDGETVGDLIAECIIDIFPARASRG